MARKETVNKVFYRIENFFSDFWRKGEVNLPDPAFLGVTPAKRIRTLLYRGGFINRLGGDTGLLSDIRRLVEVVRKGFSEWEKSCFFKNTCFQVLLFNAREKIEKEGMKELKEKINKEELTMEAVWIILRRLAFAFNRQFHITCGGRKEAGLTVSEVYPYFEKTFWIDRWSLERKLRGLRDFRLIGLDLVADLDNIYLPLKIIENIEKEGKEMAGRRVWVQDIIRFEEGEGIYIPYNYKELEAKGEKFDVVYSNDPLLEELLERKFGGKENAVLAKYGIKMGDAGSSWIEPFMSPEEAIEWIRKNTERIYFGKWTNPELRKMFPEIPVQLHPKEIEKAFGIQENSSKGKGKRKKDEFPSP